MSVSKRLEEIELRSEEVQEFISDPPSWMIRWGILTIFIIIIMFLSVTHFIRYPDVLTGEIMLTTEKPPIKVVTYASGKLKKLYRVEGESINEGEALAEIENAITQPGVDYLRRLIEDVRRFLNSPGQPVEFVSEGYVFGDIQNEYNELKQQCQNYYAWRRDHYPTDEINSLTQKIEQYSKLIEIDKRLTLISTKELVHAEEQFHANEELYANGFLSKFDFFSEESAFYAHQQEIENLKKTAAQNQITMIELEEQLHQIEHEQKETEREFQERISLVMHTLLNDIENWQQSFLIEAPISGELSYLQTLHVNQFLEERALVFAVIPENNSYIGIMNIPAGGSGKVHVGQSVRVKCDSYPYQEYGMIKGVVQKISRLPEEDSYRVEVGFPNGLFSNNKKEFEFKPEMTGDAEIVTEDLNVLERVLSPYKMIDTSN